MTPEKVDVVLQQKNISEQLANLEQRITQLELKLAQTGTASAALPTRDVPRAAPVYASERTGRPALETNIGEFVFAWFGSIILLLGVAFLMTYAHNLGYRLLAGLAGFGAALVLYVASRAWAHRIPYLSNLMISGSMVILFYATLRLHYFTSDPLLKDRTPAFAALLLSAAFPIYVALRRKSELATVLAILLGVIASLLSGTPQVGLALLVVLSLVASWQAITRRWWAAAVITAGLVYCGHVLWLLNNPMAGGELRSISGDRYSPVYLFLCAAIFLWPPLIPERSSDEASVVLVSLNCAGFLATLSLAVYALYTTSVGPAFLAGAALFLTISMVQYLKTRQQLCPAIYACSGYLMLSVGIWGYAGVPTIFHWLALQSLVVVCMALWFRSKILVVANTIIFLGILLWYVIGFPSSNLVNFSFALVAHASARIMNWQKERLTLRTEALRNVYLITGFGFILYALAHALPSQFVSLSWIGAGATYFLLSILLDNYKYRWLAIVSVLVTIVYLLTFDLPQLDPKYRVPAFLVVGVITLVISMYYTRFRQLPGGKE